MAQVLVRDLDDTTVTRLKERAARRGRSLQKEAKAILEDAVESFSIDEARENAAEWRRRFAGTSTSDSTDLIREDRDR